MTIVAEPEIVLTVAVKEGSSLKNNVVTSAEKRKYSAVVAMAAVNISSVRVMAGIGTGSGILRKNIAKSAIEPANARSALGLATTTSKVEMVAKQARRVPFLILSANIAQKLEQSIPPDCSLFLTTEARWYSLIEDYHWRNAMKAVCKVCELTFELAKVIIENDSGIEGDQGFYLIPPHPPQEGKAKTSIVSQSTGEVIEELCDGSFRPPQNFVH